MGEAKRKAARGDMPAEKFVPGVVPMGNGGVFIDRRGKVYQLRRARRIHTPELVAQAHELAREMGRTESKIIRGGSSLILPAKG